jgi:hypothetical protein
MKLLFTPRPVLLATVAADFSPPEFCSIVANSLLVYQRSFSSLISLRSYGYLASCSNNLLRVLILIPVTSSSTAS